MLNLKAIQKQLDFAASELDRQGHEDLANKVDFYSDRLQRASSNEVPLIRRALIRVNLEAKRRQASEDKKEGTKKVVSERVAELRKRLAERRNMKNALSDKRAKLLKLAMLKRRMARRRAELKKDEELDLRASRKQRLSSLKDEK